MTEDRSHPRTLKIFLASPSDVLQERDALTRLIRDINDVLAFLSPEKGLTLELVRHETHSYPDIGRPQEVINRQIPVDYDIFIGVMWSRCGTPTSVEQSGTIEEFRRAYEKRKSGHLPRIMFYFCEQQIPIPDKAALEQLEGVVKFRAEMAQEGFTWSYPSHNEFSEHVRGGLLRAIRDVLLKESGEAENESLLQPPAVLDIAAQSDIDRLAREYEEIRRTMQASGQRTTKMTALFSEMKTKAAGVQSILDKLEHNESPGMRLAAIAVLQMFPSTEHLGWLAERLDNPDGERPFVGYQAAVAMLEAIRTLPTQECGKLRNSLERALFLAKRLPEDSDRIMVLQRARQELDRRCGSQI